MTNYFLLFFFIPLVTLAQIKDNDEEFQVDDWSKGLHIFVGIGLNTSNFTSDSHKNYLGMGSNFKTDLGWYFNHDWAIESSANVRINKYKENLIWNTLLTSGVRYRLEEHYFRGFVGAGVLVVAIDENEPTCER